MKIVALVVRLLLGLMFTVFGSNGFLHFIPMGPMPANPAGQMMDILNASHFLLVVSALMVVSGVLFLVNRFVPLALVLIGPVIVFIDVFHLLLEPSNYIPAILVTVFWFVVAYSVRSALAGIFQAKVAS